MTRGRWEFWSLLSGRIALRFPNERSSEVFSKPTFWAFPPQLPFGWTGTGSAARAVFDFDSVPAELPERLPQRGYYQQPLSAADCDRLRMLGNIAEQTMKRPTDLSDFDQRTIAQELSFMALREIPREPLQVRETAEIKTAQALALYASQLCLNPEFRCIAKNLHISPAYLRQMFHKAHGESPSDAFGRVRMERAKELLQSTDLTLDVIAEKVGLSCASALARAVKEHFGVTPRKLREKRKD